MGSISMMEKRFFQTTKSFYFVGLSTGKYACSSHIQETQKINIKIIKFIAQKFLKKEKATKYEHVKSNFV